MGRAAASAIHSARFYEVYDVIATGGMATVHLGRVVGDAGFGRVVAIKRLHPQFVGDPEFAAMFIDEARLASRILHANVPSMLDVVAEGRELLLIMEYVHGESLGRLLTESRAAKEPVPTTIAVSVLSDVLHGLHAAHEATSPDGSPLRLVHRDVSPQNVLVGTDGVGRVVDFGVAKAMGRTQMTRDGAVKGKLAYMAPEQLSGRGIDRRADVYSAGVVLWETLTGARLFQADSEGELIGKVLEHVVARPRALNPNVSPALDDVTMRALARDPARRYASADEMARALELTGARASASSVGAWVKERASNSLGVRAELLARIESGAPADERSATRPRLPSVADNTTERFRFVLPAASSPDEAASVPDAQPERPARRRAIGIAAGVAAALLMAWIVVRATAPNAAPLVAVPVLDPAAPRDPSVAAPPPAPPDVASVSPPVATTTPVADPSSTSTPRARAIPPRPSPSIEPKWCKVFDPAKRIFVVKPMTGARCP